MAANLFVSFCVCFCIFVFLSTVECNRGPRMRVLTKQSQAETLTLPSNATSIREDITDNFSCDNKTYGYYADVDNDCQVFHVCLPVVYADGKNKTFRWSFICPESTLFDQPLFTCVRDDDISIQCGESPDFYWMNDSFGSKDEEDENKVPSDGTEDAMMTQEDGSMEDNGDMIQEAPQEEDTKRKRKKPVVMKEDGKRRKQQQNDRRKE